MNKQIVYFGNPAYISVERKQLKVNIKTDPPVERSLPVEDIGVVVIDHPQITITSGAISELMENNAVIIACNSSFLPHALMLPIEGHHIQTQRMRAQIEASEPLKKNLWKQTVQAKIYNQAVLLDMQGVHDHPLYHILDQIRSGDTTNREAVAANYYWSHVFPDIAGFVRYPSGPYPNNFLNYGYAVLRAVMARAVVAAGLFPSLGIHHHNKYNPYCLADDLMEPYRPYVDRLVIQLLEKFPQKTELDKDIKKEMFTIPHIDVIIEKETSPLIVAAQRTASSLAHCFLGEKKKIVYPEMKPLKSRK